MIGEVLQVREENYGRFADRARIEQALIETMECSGGWHRLSPAQKSAARMIAVKLSRILNCNPDHRDGWIDIAGYATLAAGDGE
jgi:hypothetical protein